MRSFRHAMAFLIIALQFSAQNGSPSQHSQHASDVVREQLRGLKFVDLVVYVSPFNIVNTEELENGLQQAAKRILCKTGLQLGTRQKAWLSIEVLSIPVESQDYLIVQVWTKLYEEAILKRAPSLRNPHGYITWDTNWAGLVRKEDMEEFALREAKDQLEDFCLDWETARDWAKKPPRCY